MMKEIQESITKRKKLLIIILSLIVIFSFVGFSINDLLTNPPNWLITAAVSGGIGSDLLSGDSLYVILIGTGAPMPDLNRVGPCVVIQAGSRARAGKNLFVVDAGAGSARNIMLSGLDFGELGACFMTHYHSDHIAGLGELFLNRWATGLHTEPLPVYGPVGVTSVVEGFNKAYKLDVDYRIAHHGEKAFPRSGAGGEAVEFDLGKDSMASEVIYEENGVIVTAFNVDHYPVYPAVGYKFEYKGRSVVISGDTVYTENLVENARETDVLICEAINLKLNNLIIENAVGNNVAKIASDITDYHMSPEDAARTAKNANVNCLVLYHILPPTPHWLLENYFTKGMNRIYEGNLILGRDGLLISMPPYSTEITTEDLL
jgi:ribonuclease Z